jgi:PIN domain nuclease of toxin-antitoxin system
MRARKAITHLFTLDSLPKHHKDPFYRLLISQAIVENAVLVSGDSILANYPVKIEW